MIKIYTGRPGSGKSYNAVANVLIPSLKQNRTVVTNLPLVKSEIYQDFPDANIFTVPFNLTKDDVARVFVTSNFPAGSIFIIDEAGKLFPAGWAISKAPTSLLTFFTEHRHVVSSDGKASEIFLLAQDVSQVAKWIKDMVDSTYLHKKLDKVGFENKYAVSIFDGVVSIDRIVKTKIIDESTGTYSSDIYKYYKSYTKSDSLTDTALESNPDNRASYIKKIRLLLGGGVLLVVVCVIGFIFAFKSVFGTSSDSETPDSLPPKSVPSTQVNSKTSLASTTDNSDFSISYSKKYRLTGVFITSGEAVAIVESEHAVRRLDLLESCSYERIERDWVCDFQGEKVAKWSGTYKKESASFMDLNPVPTFDDESRADGAH